MAFNLMGGLSAMGGAIAQTAGTAALEIQRSELEKEKMSLADALAARRQDDSQDFQAGESLLNRQHDDSQLATREAGEDRRQGVSEAGQDRRQDVSEKGQDRRAAMSEGSTQKRFDEEMQFRIDQAKQAVTDKTEDRAVNAAVMSATKTVMEEYTTAAGDKATRPVKYFDPAKAAGILNDAGYPDLAKPFTVPKPKAAKPIEGQTVKQGGHTFKVINGKYVAQD